MRNGRRAPSEANRQERGSDLVLSTHGFTTETLYNPGQISDIVGISVSTLATWRSLGTGPGWLKTGRKIWYPVVDFDFWMEGQRGNQRNKAGSGITGSR